MKKKQRHQLILKLVSTHYLSTQQDLIESLRECGIEATQSSISRDIKYLGLVKRAGQYHCPLPDAGNSSVLFDKQQRKYIQKVEMINPYMIVMKTQAATAQAIAAALDKLAWPEIAGTIAGDDTIFVATRSADHAKSIIKRLYS